MVGRTGEAAAWTGPECAGYAGHRTGDGYTLQGNLLTGPEVLDTMQSAWTTSADVPLRRRHHVVAMLDYYEFLPSLALRGYVDVRMLLGLRGSAMSRCFECCRGYIDHRREHVGDELYRSVQVLVREYDDQIERRAR